MTEEELRHFLNDGMSYGAIARKIGRSTKFVRRRADRYGLKSRQALGDLSSSGPHVSKEDLTSLLEQGLSTHKIAEKIGRSQGYVCKRLKKWGLSSICPPGPPATSVQKRSISRYCQACVAPLSTLRKYCNASCQARHRYEKYILAWKEGKVDGNKGYGPFMGVSNHIRRYLFEKFNSRCSRCGWCEVNPHSGNIPLTVEHLNGDGTDSREENLDLICPNCHSLTPTYCGLNAGKGRGSRTGVANTALRGPRWKREQGKRSASN